MGKGKKLVSSHRRGKKILQYRGGERLLVRLDSGRGEKKSQSSRGLTVGGRKDPLSPPGDDCGKKGGKSGLLSYYTRIAEGEGKSIHFENQNP